jgi:hypothetical protein
MMQSKVEVKIKGPDAVDRSGDEVFSFSVFPRMQPQKQLSCKIVKKVNELAEKRISRKAK